MKKICTIILILAAFGGIVATQMQGKTDDTYDPYVLASIEALTDNESTSNTGPAEEKKCVGGAHRMVCRCQNSYPCTGTDCY